MKSVESDDSSQAKAYATVEWPLGCFINRMFITG
jgi:RPA family protein